MASTGIVETRGHRGIATVLILSVALVLLLCIAAILATPGGHRLTRGFADPHVFTHLFGLLPLALALHLHMPITAFITAVALITSTLYHVDHEGNSHFVFAFLDITFASLSLIWFTMLLLISFTLPYDGVLLSTTLILTFFALGAFMLPSVLRWLLPGGGDAGDGEEPSCEERACRYDRLHPLWHLTAFLAMAGVLANFKRTCVRLPTEGHTWLGRVHRFHF